MLPHQTASQTVTLRTSQITCLAMKKKEEVIKAFKDEFGAVAEKFVIMDLLEDGTLMEYKAITEVRLPSKEYNRVFYPGVYVFIGNDTVYRVGVSMRNSRERVRQHINAQRTIGVTSIMDIDQFSDRSILLFNVDNPEDRHWLLALEVFLEKKFEPLIRSKRVG